MSMAGLAAAAALLAAGGPAAEKPATDSLVTVGEPRQPPVRRLGRFATEAAAARAARAAAIPPGRYATAIVAGQARALDGGGRFIRVDPPAGRRLTPAGGDTRD